MLKLSLPSLLAAFAFAAVLPATLSAEVDKDRKEDLEKAEKEARPELDEGAGDDHEEYHRRLAEEGQENLKEIQRLLDEIQNDLAGKKTGAATQARQQEVVKKLSQLAEKVGKNCSNCSSGGGGGSPKPSSSQKKPEDGKDQKRQGKPRENQDQVASPQQEKQQKQEQDQDPKDPGKVPNDDVKDGKLPEERIGSLLEKMRKGGRWGFLPPKLREEILSSGGKEAPAEYRDIIDRYYQRISDYYGKQR